MPVMKRQQIASFGEFVRASESEISAIGNYLRTRNFKDGQRISSEFLEKARAFLEIYEDIRDYSLRLEFLRGVVYAWEVCDSSNTFNHRSLPKSYGALTRFAGHRLNELSEIRSDAMLEYARKDSELSYHYLTETARSVLIRIGETYRSQRDAEKCRQELDEIISFASNRFDNLVDRKPNSLLAQCYFYAAKLARSRGDLGSSRENLLRAFEVYREESFALSKMESGIEISVQLNDIQMRTGVLQVSFAWYYFSQGQYDSAIHTALCALLMLAGTKDRITQNHAELALFAARRAGAVDVDDIEMIIARLSHISAKFAKYKHSRLKTKTDYELIQALINLDAMSDDRTGAASLSQVKGLLSSHQDKAGVSPKWKSLFKTLESRFQRRSTMQLPVRDRNFKQAVDAAREAEKLAMDLRNPFCRLEALIALGESHFYQHRESRKSDNLRSDSLDSARTAFLEADKICEHLCRDGGFPDLNGVVKLYLARIALASGDDHLSAYYLKRFDSLENRQHGRLKRLEKRVMMERDESNVDEFRLDENGHAANQLRLKELLIRRARRAVDGPGKITDDLVARELGITRQTLSKWRRQIKEYYRIKLPGTARKEI